MNLLDRIWSKTNRDGPVTDARIGPCWIYEGTLLKSGHGIIRDPELGQIRVHRAVYILVNGPLESEERVYQVCRTPACVRPEHIKKGTLYAAKRVAALDPDRPHGNARLSDEQIAVIRKMYAESPESVSHISDIYDVSERTIQRIVSGLHRLTQPVGVGRPRQTSRYRGVSRYVSKKRPHGCWRIRLTVNGKTISRYTSGSEEDAARIYNQLAHEHFGPAAILNQIQESA